MGAAIVGRTVKRSGGILDQPGLWCVSIGLIENVDRIDHRRGRISPTRAQDSRRKGRDNAQQPHFFLLKQN